MAEQSKQKMESVLEALVVYDTRNYFLVEVTSPRALESVREDEELVLQAIAQFLEHASLRETGELDQRELGLLAMRSVTEGIDTLEASSAGTWDGPWYSEHEAASWSGRPTTGSWETDEVLAHRTGEFATVTPEQLRVRLLRHLEAREKTD